MATVTPHFYVFHGNDEIAIKASVTRFRNNMSTSPNADLNIDEFDGEKASVAEVLNAACSYPFLSDKRLVIVRDMLQHLGRKGAGNTGKQAMERLANELPELPESARLVFVESVQLGENHPVVRLAQSQSTGYCKAFIVPKDTTNWIIQRVRKTYGKEIEGKAAYALAEVTGEDIQRADNEIAKLVAYIDDETTIREEDVAALTPYVAEANIFAMVDALATGNSKVALSLLNQALNENPRDDGFGIFGLIVSQFRRLLLTREHLALGGGTQPATIAKAVGIRSNWQAEKLSRQSRAFTLEQLDRIYRQLQRYDYDMKIGKIKPRLALDLFIASMGSSPAS